MNIEFLIQSYIWQPYSSVIVIDNMIPVTAVVNMAQSSSYFSKYAMLFYLYCDKYMYSLPRSVNWDAYLTIYYALLTI